MNTTSRFCCVLLTAAFLFPAFNARAVNLVGNDVYLDDATPAITFNDTDAANSYEYVILGEAAFFKISEGATSIFNHDTNRQSTAVGYNASSGGDYSTALGNGASSAGDYSTALGNGASSGGDYSTALGNGASSAGISSIALGDGASSAGYSTALGNGASSAGISSIALGNGASSGGNLSTALGDSASSAGDYSAALGISAFSGGLGSVALGVYATSGGAYSTALGNSASSGGDLSTALGFGASSAGAYSTAIGYNASAPNPDTIILGEIPSVNYGLNYTAVANGTTDPLAPLHIFRDDGTAQVLVEETSTDAVPRTLFRLASEGSNAKFEIDNLAAGVNWAFTNSGADFRVSRQGSGVVEFRVDNDGNAFIHNNLDIGGTLTEMSDRNQKHAIMPLDGDVVLAKIVQVPVAEWSYNGEPEEARHIGPMAQDFYAAFGLASGETRISARDMAGVNMAAIQALEARNRELAQVNNRLQSENRSLRERMEAVEAGAQRIETLESRLARIEDLLPKTDAVVAQTAAP